MTIKWHQRYLMGILPTVIGLLMGCSAFIEFLDNNPKATPSTADNRSLEHAIAIYRHADYTRALDLFGGLATADTDKGQRHTAQLGIICSRLMLADTQAELNVAISMWSNYRMSISDEALSQELALFDPIMARLPVSTTGSSADTRPSPVPQATSPPAAKKKLETELAVMKKKAAQATELQRQLDAVVAENRTLKQKIKALEAIDQNIQKKKTEISAPSE